MIACVREAYADPATSQRPNLLEKPSVQEAKSTAMASILASTTFPPRLSSPSPAPPSIAFSRFRLLPTPSIFHSPRRPPAAALLPGAAPNRVRLSVRCFTALKLELKSTLDSVVESHKVVLFMKGTKDFPQRGFSNTVVQILKSLNVPFETLNILENEMLRQGLKEYSSWPTFPQLYIDGQLFGGCDVTVDAFKSGELQELLEKAMCSK